MIFLGEKRSVARIGAEKPKMGGAISGTAQRRKKKVFFLDVNCNCNVITQLRSKLSFVFKAFSCLSGENTPSILPSYAVFLQHYAQLMA